LIEGFQISVPEFRRYQILKLQLKPTGFPAFGASPEESLPDQIELHPVMSGLPAFEIDGQPESGESPFFDDIRQPESAVVIGDDFSVLIIEMIGDGI
jgi:hypothetical protein